MKEDSGPSTDLDAVPGSLLLTWIAEVADEPLELEPTDRRVECETNTWSLNAEAEERQSLSVAEVVAAFERTAATIHSRVRGTGFTGAATFYVWYDSQADQLRCSTGSVPPDGLPFAGPYYQSDDLAPIVADFLSGGGAATLPWPELTDVSASGDAEGAADPVELDPEPRPFPVWVSAAPVTTCRAG